MTTQALYAEDQTSEVSVYTASSSVHLGRSEDRSMITGVNLESFMDSETVSAGREGIATAVMIEERVKLALDDLLSNRDYVIIENSVLRRESGYKNEAYGFTWEKYDFDIVFSFEKAGREIIPEIERIYGNDAYLYGELKRSYDDNYSIRIYEAEDVLSPVDGKISFLEAMISATVIGSTFQPLLGIHDGLGVLDDLGLASAREQIVNNDEYIEYRPYETDGDELYSFIHSIENMEGDFVENLFTATGSITQRKSDDGKILLPEEFFNLRTGDNTDYVLFYFDILKRSGYQVKLALIDTGSADGELYSIVFFREKGADIWGWIDSTSLERERGENWRRLPALVFSATVKYFEPDIENIITSRKIILPPPSKWFTSLY